MMNTIIEHLREGGELNTRQIEAAAQFLLSEEAEDSKKATFLEALAEKGETAQEIAGFVESFLEFAVPVDVTDLDLPGPTIDVCGTGGDRLNLFNVSTTAMFVLAGGGAVVLKHGNRGATSKSGGADVLEALGINIEQGPSDFRETVQRAGVGFMFARAYHPAFKAIAGVRAELAKKGVKTIFNLVGPLLNPARPQCQLVGVAQQGRAPVFAEILQQLGREAAWAVHGMTVDGRDVDEVSLMGPTRIWKSGSYLDLVDEEICPEDFGFENCPVEALVGGDADENAQILHRILNNEEQGPRRDMVLLNAGAGFACAGLSDDLAGGIELAREVLTDGLALERLQLMQGK